MELTNLDKSILNGFQRDFPLCSQPYAEIADRLGVDEADVIAALARLRELGVVSRLGAVVRPHRMGWSTLAAIAVPPERLEEVAALVSSYPEVNHNYARDHQVNLWFVVAACDEESVAKVLHQIAERSGLEVLDLPLEEAFCLDLGFRLKW
ncbi:MAG: AsnC family transcriptional regulator [Pseudomonadota bacterium]